MRRVFQAGSRLLNASSALRSSTQPCLSMTSRLYSSETITCTLFPGDGIGPEIADAVKEIFEAAKAPIDWDEQYIGKVADPRTNSMVTRENLDSVLVRPTLHIETRFVPSIWQAAEDCVGSSHHFKLGLLHTVGHAQYDWPLAPVAFVVHKVVTSFIS